MKLQHNSQKAQTMLNITSGILTMTVQLAVNFFLSPYIVKTLGEEANGFIQLANNFVTYASLLTIAFNSMAGRFISVSYHRNEDTNVKKYYSTTYICNILISIALLVVSIFIVINLDRIIKIEITPVSEVKLLFCFVFLNFIANLFLSIYGIALFVQNRIYIQNVINLFRAVLNAVLLLGVFYALPARIFYVSFISLILTTMSIPILRFFQHKYMPRLKIDTHFFCWSALFEMVKSGIWNTVNQCGNMLMTGFDLLLANWFINPIQMGILSVAKIIPNAISQLAGMLNTSFAPSITMEWAKGDKDVTIKRLRSSMKISSVMVSIPIITFSFYSKWFYQLWMPTLDSSLLSALSFLSCMAFIPWAGPQALYNVYTAANKLKINSITFVISGCMNVLIVYCLLLNTNMGVYAIASVSSIISIIRNLVVTAPYTAKILGLKWHVFYKDVLISIICCSINFLVAALVSRFIYGGGWLMLVGAVLITCFLTFILDMIFILDKRERVSLLRYVRRN